MLRDDRDAIENEISQDKLKWNKKRTNNQNEAIKKKRFGQKR